MRGAELLRINQRITIKVEDPGYRGTYASLVQDMSDNDVIISMPLVDCKPVPIRPGTRVTILAVSRGTTYGLPGVVVGRSLNPTPLLRVSLRDDAQPLQRRRFVRVEVDLPFYFRSLDDAASLRKPMEVGTTRDISGSGALISVPLASRQLPSGTNLQVEIVLPGRSIPIRGKARVIRMWTVRDASRETQNMAVEFTELADSDREDIIKFVLERQKELRRKGLL
ncbi:MAG TPA: flagellar brake protein [Firmicutes bacterium]|nr:flagellar brake protein [Bacillota bacterium]